MTRIFLLLFTLICHCWSNKFEREHVHETEPDSEPENYDYDNTDYSLRDGEHRKNVWEKRRYYYKNSKFPPSPEKRPLSRQEQIDISALSSSSPKSTNKHQMKACLGGTKAHLPREIINCMIEINQICPDITKLQFLGKSTGGEDMAVLIFTNEAQTNATNSRTQPGQKTNINLFANMHGNEITGRELLYWFMVRFCKKSGHSKFRNFLLKSNIYIIPSLNPDGAIVRHKTKYRDDWTPGDQTKRNNFYENYVNGRYLLEKNAVDQSPINMNRDFPNLNKFCYGKAKNYLDMKKLIYNSQIFNTTHFHKYSTDRLNRYAKETRIIMKYMDKVKFDYGINFHDGTRVINYPFDLGLQNRHRFTPAPDHQLLESTAKIWGKHNHKFLESNLCGEVNTFKDGITNGAAWYSVDGSIQDYAYIKFGTQHYTVEVSCDKYPSDKRLAQIVQENKWALLKYIERFINISAIYGHLPASYPPYSRVEFRSESLFPEKRLRTFPSASYKKFWTYSDKDGYFKKSLMKDDYRMYVNNKFVKKIKVVQNGAVNVNEL